MNGPSVSLRQGQFLLAVPLFTIKRSRIDNRDAAEWIKRKQICVARDNHVGASKDSQFRKLVVVRIAACVQIADDRHELRSVYQVGQITDKSKIAEQVCELGFAERETKFGFGRAGFKKDTALLNPANDIARRGVGFQTGANENIRIDAGPHEGRCSVSPGDRVTADVFIRLPARILDKGVDCVITQTRCFDTSAAVPATLGQPVFRLNRDCDQARGIDTAAREFRGYLSGSAFDDLNISLRHSAPVVWNATASPRQAPFP
jgi:hypothetical protein